MNQRTHMYGLHSRHIFDTVNTPSRRRFVAALGVLPFASTGVWAGSARSVRLDHLHTGEKLDIVYFAEGNYVADALAAVNHFLRDFRTGDVGRIDAALLDQLARLAAATGSRRPFEVISGYRSMVTNEALRRHSGGVASNSLHTRGQAIDIRLADVPLDTLRAAARSLRAGGVGFYPASNFVHVDTGRVRFW